MNTDFAVRVDCDAGYRGEDVPRRLHLGKLPVDIAEVMDCWLAHDSRYFKVRGVDRHVYLLRHDVAAAQWELTQFRRRDQPL